MATSKISYEENFDIYHEGVALHLKWTLMPSTSPTSSAGAAVIRVCAINDKLLLLITADYCLYTARRLDDTLQLEQQRTKIIDVDYCSQTKQLFIVTSAGVVLMQQLNTVIDYENEAFELLTFDPLELSEEGIHVQRVCCSAQGVLFETRKGHIYVMGSCGDVFVAESLPKHMRLFDESKHLMNFAAGDDYFVALLRQQYDEQDDPLNLYNKKLQQQQQQQQQNRPGTSSQFTPSPRLTNRQSTTEIEFSAADDEDNKKQELTSNSSIRSFSSKSTHSQIEQDFDTNQQQLLKDGFTLIHTQVQTFGAMNNGLLGTADHIKRATINNVQKLDSIGICNIATGKEHSLARTLDGRLFHWGLNSKQQLNGKKELLDLSTPTQIKFDKMEMNALQRNTLYACCGDFQTVLLNARGELHAKERKLLAFDEEFMSLQMNVVTKKQIPLLLAAGSYTIHNRRQLRTQYHSYFNNLQTQLKLMLKYRHAIQMLQIIQQKTSAPAVNQLQQICQNYKKLLYLLAVILKSWESFYRCDFESPADLLFIRYYRECIELFEDYSKAYCDILSIDGFTEAGKLFSQFSTLPLMPEQTDECDLTRIFQQPLQIFPNFVQFLEQITKTYDEYMEHLLAWEVFTRQNRIDLELAEHTQDFWHRNERNIKIRSFQRKNRRVILTSSHIPLKLATKRTNFSMTNTTFILFSDCLCQVNSQVNVFRLAVMWVKIENETTLRITTPERTFSLVSNTHHNKNLWYDQLVSSINGALGRPGCAKLTNVRTTSYIFSKNHTKYPDVHAYGRWRNGVLHGNAYLEYPNGKFYFGEMRSGEIEGFGRMVIPSVGLYEGTFKAGKFNGHGNFELKDNEVYDGNFRDGVFHGHGSLRSNNFTYVGEFQGNARNGYGVLDNMINGDKYMGMFADNKRAGAGTCITMNGDYFEGVFVNDELTSTGIAVFENDYYYEGELNMRGPSGKGTYYMPVGLAEPELTGINYFDEFSNRQLIGNVLSGQLGGSWEDVRVISGTMSIHRQFPKYPHIGELVVDNNRKWRSLFDNFEEQILGSAVYKKSDNNPNATKNIWSRLVAFMNTQIEREKTFEQQQQQQQESAYPATQSYFGRNISMGFSGSIDKISLKSTTSLMTTHLKSSNLDLNGSLNDTRRSYSQETLYGGNDMLQDFDIMNNFSITTDDNPFSNILNAQFAHWANDSTTGSSRSSIDSALNLSGSMNNNNNSYSSQCGLDIVPNFGITSINENDVISVKEYLQQAFKDRHHPLYILNERVTNCFYNSYGCWKVKPTPLLAKQAMREWESISKRVYRFVRKMFPALPEDYCVLESSREVISHITLLYPIVLSEGIYSTLFVLYASKYSKKDEMYRQNLIFADKLKDNELAECLSLDCAFLSVIRHECFTAAIQSLKQLQEKYSPKAMLTVIENCMQQITDAHKFVESENTVILAADSMMPLTLFLVLRAAVPHLGAELALLDDLTGGSNFQFEMNGLAGYCFTTLKASYEHITSKPLNKT